MRCNKHPTDPLFGSESARRCPIFEQNSGFQAFSGDWQSETCSEAAPSLLCVPGTHAKLCFRYWMTAQRYREAIENHSSSVLAGSYRRLLRVFSRVIRDRCLHSGHQLPPDATCLGLAHHRCPRVHSHSSLVLLSTYASDTHNPPRSSAMARIRSRPSRCRSSVRHFRHHAPSSTFLPHAVHSCPRAQRNE